jgi:centrosomal protein CEP41
MGLMATGNNAIPNHDTKSQISHLSSVSGISAVTYATEALGITDQTSFLLLDLRDPDEYDFWRIKESLNYPVMNIARDKMTPELFRFKNKANKLIIVYMNDERRGAAAANLLAEKGYENVFLLSGGIEQFNEEFNNLVEGRDVPMPKSIIKEEETKKRMEKSTAIKMRQ